MFEELLFMVGFVLFALILSYILLNYTPRPLDMIFKALAIVGIIIHELSQVIICLITNARIEKIRLLERYKSNNNRKNEFKGKVIIGDTRKLTFLQAALIGLAPIYISFWLFFFLYHQIQNPANHISILFLYFLLMISICLGAYPSIGDLIAIGKAIGNNPRYTLYQIFILALAIGTTWLIFSVFSIIVFHEIIIYGVIFVVYYIFKYGFMGVNALHYHLSSRKKRNLGGTRLKTRKLMRKRHKSLKPRKLGIKEAHW